MRETFLEQLYTKLESLKFDNVESGWNSFRRTICEVADDVLAKKVKTAAMNTSEKALCLIKGEWVIQELSE